DQPLAVAVRDVEQLAHLVRQTARERPGHETQGAANGGERRAQLVAHDRDELALEALDLLLLADVLDLRHEIVGTATAVAHQRYAEQRPDGAAAAVVVARLH